MKKVTGKRFLAYILDIIFVLVVSSLFGSLTFLNPKLDEYNEVYSEYMEAYSDYTETILEGKEAEVKALEAKINDLTYDVSKASVYVTLINIICLVLYFAIFQYYNGGKTLGKRLLKIKVVSSKKEELKFWQVLVRSLIINSILISTIALILLVTLSKKEYNSIYSVLQWIDIAFLYGSAGFMIFRQDGKGIHDIIASTNVRPMEEEKEIREVTAKEETIKEAKEETVKEEKTKKTTQTKKTNAKRTASVRDAKVKEKK